jgi:PKD repeat protein
LTALLLVVFVGVSGATVPATTSAVASCTASPTTVAVGEQVTLDASNSDAVYVEFDVDGDGTFERIDETDFEITTSYSEPGTYETLVRAQNDPSDIGFCGTITVEAANEPPSVDLFVTPNPTTVGRPTTFDAQASDQDGTIVEYRWDFDGDGNIEVTSGGDTVSYEYVESGTYVGTVTAVDDDGATRSASGDISVVKSENIAPSADFSVSPRPGQAGSVTTFDASGSSDPDGSIQAYRWDFDGDGVRDRTTTSATTSYIYTSAGEYAASLQVVDNNNATAFTLADYSVSDASGVQAACTIEPRRVAPGDSVTIDARGSENAQFIDYDTDGDGEYEAFERTNFTYTVRYDESGTYTPLVRTYGNGETAIGECPAVTVGGENQPPTAAFSVDPAGPTTDDTVSFNASNSRDPDGTISTYRWDFDGDGSFELVTGQPVVTHTYARNGSVVPTVEVTDDDNATAIASRDLFVEEGMSPEPGPGEGGIIPLVPIGIGAGGLLGLGGLYYLFSSGGGSGGPAGGGDSSMDSKPKRKPKPKQGSDKSLQYETGVFALPSSSSTVSVPVDFNPDLLLFSTTNGARTDPATDRTTGWCRGIAHTGDEGINQQSITVADDANHTDQATCITDDAQAFQLLRHQPDAAPGRIQAEVSDTSRAGFALDVSIPGDDPLAGGIRVAYQAIQFPGSVSLDVNNFLTPTEPGTQTVDLGLEADHIALLGSGAVTGLGRLWTTDRGLGLSVGLASDDEGVISQTTYGTSVWPRAGHDSAAVSRTDRGLQLLYQDADRLAGRTSATISSLGETLRLQYDRVYNGPHKLGSTARHVVPYLALDGGEKARPAVGAVSLPPAGESVSIDCGFEPAMIEVTVSGASLAEEAEVGATAQPFGWSFGTAIADEERIRQYVLHHALAPDLPDASVSESEPSGGTTERGRTEAAATDGGLDAGLGARDSVAAPSSGTATEGGKRMTAPKAREHADDEHLGISLRQAPDGAIVGRETVQVDRMHESGFDLSVHSPEVDGEDSSGRDRPSVHYRAWPAADATRTDTATGQAVPTAEDGDHGEREP